VITPSLNFRDPNPNVDWAIPFRVNTELREWPQAGNEPRRPA
jgi:acyl transferase domain-containing protein